MTKMKFIEIYDEKPIDFYSKTPIYKLRGTVRAYSNGFTFSHIKYIQESTKTKDFKLEQLLNDLQKHTFIFIGTSFSEELDIEMEILKNGEVSNQLYFISPSWTDRKQRRIKDFFYNSIFIEMNAEEFVNEIMSYNKTNFQNHFEN